MGQAAPSERQEIARAIQQLGASRFAEREEASRRLWQAGPSAEAALTKAAQSSDLEVKRRAQAILDQFRWGIYPDTPRDVVALVQEFRAGGLQVRRAALAKLRSEGRIEEAIRLVDAAQDDNLRRGFYAAAAEMAAELCLASRFDLAERVLLEGASPGPQGWLNTRHLATFWLLQGTLDERMKELAEPPIDERAASLLAHLLIVQGKPREALVHAERLGDLALVSEALSRAGDWTALADESRLPGDPGIERLGFAAALHGLAGNSARRREAIEAIKGLAKQSPSSAWLCGEALMINEQWSAAAEILLEHAPDRGFALLAAQGDPVAALRRVGLEDPATAPDWLTKRLAAQADPKPDREVQIRLALAACRSLGSLGERPAAVALLERVGQEINEDSASLWTAFAETALAFAEREKAEAAILQALENPHTRAEGIFALLFPKRAAAAAYWWTARREERPDEPKERALRHVRSLVDPDDEQSASLDELDRLAKGVEARLEAQAHHDRGAALHALAETYLAHGQRERALALLVQRAQQETEDGEPNAAERAERMLRVADHLAEEENWPEAALWHQRAWNLDRRQALPLMLEGWAREKSGDAEGGREKMALAALLPLADVSQRQWLAEKLEKRGLSEQAISQWRLAWQLGPWHQWEGPHAWAVSSAHRQLGNHVAKTAPLEAAEHWQRWMLFLLKTNSAFTKVEFYPQIMSLIRKARSRGLWLEGSQEDSLREAQAALESSAEDVDFVIELVQRLDEANRREAAQASFDACYALHERIRKAFPNSSRHLNNQAWLAARCGRRLDEALSLARRAVELEPDRAGYVDTLAEVHEQRGELDEALRHARRCVELEGANDEFQRRLARLEKSP